MPINIQDKISDAFLKATGIPSGKYFYYTSETYRRYNYSKMQTLTRANPAPPKFKRNSEDGTVGAMIDFLVNNFGPGSVNFAEEINKITSQDLKVEIDKLAATKDWWRIGIIKGKLAEEKGVPEFIQRQVDAAVAKSFSSHGNRAGASATVVGSQSVELDSKLKAALNYSGKKTTSRTRLTDISIEITGVEDPVSLNISVKWFGGTRNPNQSLGQIQPSQIYQSNIGGITKNSIFNFANLLSVHDNKDLSSEFQAFQVYFTSRLVKEVMFGGMINDIPDLFITKSGFVDAATVYNDVMSNIGQMRFLPGGEANTLDILREPEPPDKTVPASERAERTRNSWNKFLALNNWRLYRMNKDFVQLLGL